MTMMIMIRLPYVRMTRGSIVVATAVAAAAVANAVIAV